MRRSLKTWPRTHWLMPSVEVPQAHSVDHVRAPADWFKIKFVLLSKAGEYIYKYWVQMPDDSLYNIHPYCLFNVCFVICADRLLKRKNFYFLANRETVIFLIYRSSTWPSLISAEGKCSAIGRILIRGCRKSKCAILKRSPHQTVIWYFSYACTFTRCLLIQYARSVSCQPY